MAAFIDSLASPSATPQNVASIFLLNGSELRHFTANMALGKCMSGSLDDSSLASDVHAAFDPDFTS